MAQRQTIIEAWFVAVLAQFARLGIELDGQDHTPLAANAAAPKYLQLVHIRRLWHRAFELRPDPYLGLRVGCGLAIQAMNVLAVIIMHSGTLRKALNNIVRYHALVSNSGHYRLVHTADGALALEYDVTDCVIPMHPAQMDSVFAGALTFFSSCFPGMAGHYEVELPGTDTQLAEGYAGYLGCAVTLGVPKGRMLFSDRILDTPWAGADGQLLSAACEIADQRLRALGYAHDLLDQVTAMIMSDGFANTDLTQIANALGLSRRSLQRRLSAANTNYRHLVEAARIERALDLLRLSDMPTYRIAEAVGYAEPGALSHAVKRHLGKTPKALRAEFRRHP